MGGVMMFEVDGILYCHPETNPFDLQRSTGVSVVRPMAEITSYYDDVFRCQPGICSTCGWSYTGSAAIEATD